MRIRRFPHRFSRRRLLQFSSPLIRQSKRRPWLVPSAIRRIIAERNELRRDGECLRGVIQELRHENAKTANAGEQYKQLATKNLLQLKQMHQAIQDAQNKIRQLSTNTLEDRDPD